MAVSKVNDKDLENGLELLANSCVDVIYLVDSFGAFYPEQIRRLADIYLNIAAKTGKKIGIHAHNNQNLAFANTIEGLTAGISYLDATDISPMGRVLLFYINAEDGENFTDSMFAAVEKTDEIIPVISYRKNGALAVISDRAVYGVGSDGGELWNYSLENTVDQAALGNKEYIVLALGDGVANKDGREKGTVCWLDGSGNEKGSFASGESVTYLLAAEKGIVVGNDRDYTGVTYSGNESWNYTAITDLNDLIPMEKLNRVMAVGKNEISVYAMTKGKKQTNATKAADTENASVSARNETTQNEKTKNEAAQKQ